LGLVGTGCLFLGLLADDFVVGQDRFDCFGPVSGSAVNRWSVLLADYQRLAPGHPWLGSLVADMIGYYQKKAGIGLPRPLQGRMSKENRISIPHNMAQKKINLQSNKDRC